MRKRGCVLVTLLGNGDGEGGKKKPIPRERNPYEVATFRECGSLVDEAKLPKNRFRRIPYKNDMICSLEK